MPSDSTSPNPMTNGEALTTPDDPSSPSPKELGQAGICIADYEFCKHIGRGSYGQVWLAKSATGAFRAIKVVFRNAFDADRPYEREFKGIREFEPISRSHPGQLDILHVGRNDEEGFFYYVMELADDDVEFPDTQTKHDRTGRGRETQGSTSRSSSLTETSSTRREVNPITYAPKTLQSMLKQRGRLDPLDCLSIAVSLTEALGHLHANELVHRDIKPANIIFVRNQPKLADIGLVAHADEQLSIVGTEGFLPPEGPGKRTADIYSLGKVFYEMATGNDRRDFPKPPPVYAHAHEQRAFVEFNEVVLRCCESVVDHRYKSTADLLTDLNLLRQGRSIRRLRVMEQKLKALRQILAFGALSLIALGGFGWHLWQAQRSEQMMNRQLSLSHLQVSESRAVLAMQQNLPLDALLWSADTLEKAQEHPEIEARQRWRIGVLLGIVPKTEALIPINSTARSCHFSPDGRYLFGASSDVLDG